MVDVSEQIRGTGGRVQFLGLWLLVLRLLTKLGGGILGSPILLVVPRELSWRVGSGELSGRVGLRELKW